MFKRIILVALLKSSTALPLCDGATKEEACTLTQSELSKYVLYAPKPHYPPEARIARLEGEGLFQLNVDKTGVVTSVEIRRSAGNYRLLDAPVVVMLQAWRFRALPRGCKGVLISIKFKRNPW